MMQNELLRPASLLHRSPLLSTFVRFHAEIFSNFSLWLKTTLLLRVRLFAGVSCPIRDGAPWTCPVVGCRSSEDRDRGQFSGFVRRHFSSETGESATSPAQTELSREDVRHTAIRRSTVEGHGSKSEWQNWKQFWPLCTACEGGEGAAGGSADQRVRRIFVTGPGASGSSVNFCFATVRENGPQHQCACVIADGSSSTLQQGGCRSSEDPAHHQCSGHELDSSPVSLFGHGRLWPNRLWPNRLWPILVFWSVDRLWQTDFGQF